MYRLDWVENLKLRTTALPTTQDTTAVSPAVWRLGFTSLLTDISAEMVNSALPLYLVLYLHASPLAFGIIDGFYHGMAVALLSLGGGLLADRWGRHKEIAAAGYGLSAICKLGLLAAGASQLGIGLATAIDRVGKGARVAPRDALLSLNSSPSIMATSFAVHRALDAGGSLLGPMLAFLLISRLPGAYDALWLTSFVFALLGLAILVLFVRNPSVRSDPGARVTLGAALKLLKTSEKFRAAVFAGGVLATATVSDGFVYLMLQQQSGASASYFPLYYVVTAASYMLLSVPVGRLADRVGRKHVLLPGYAVLLSVYAILASGAGLYPWLILLLLGLYYAATEGVLMAIASTAVPPSLRTSGLALLTTVAGFGKMASSVAFGWLWHTYGSKPASMMFLVLMALAVLASAQLLRSTNDEA